MALFHMKEYNIALHIIIPCITVYYCYEKGVECLETQVWDVTGGLFYGALCCMKEYDIGTSLYISSWYCLLLP